MSTSPNRRRSEDIPTVDCVLPRCPICGDTIERYNGGTRERFEPDGSIVRVTHTECQCGERLKIRFR